MTVLGIVVIVETKSCRLEPLCQFNSLRFRSLFLGPLAQVAVAMVVDADTLFTNVPHQLQSSLHQHRAIGDVDVVFVGGFANTDRNAIRARRTECDPYDADGLTSATASSDSSMNSILPAHDSVNLSSTSTI